jgi:hypothetical protein
MSTTRSGSGTDGYSAETWTYLGIRAGAKGRRSHAWQEPSGRVWLYNDTGSYVTGGLYAVKVDRTSERLTRTTPEYTGQISPDVDLGELEALSKAARVKPAWRANAGTAPRTRWTTPWNRSWPSPASSAQPTTRTPSRPTCCAGSRALGGDRRTASPEETGGDWHD